MTHIELILAECAARQCGDLARAEQLRALRWERAMGLIINSANTTTEMTDQGEQIVFPGAERSAHQAVAARGAKMRPKVAQREPGGMFELEPRQPGLFDAP